MGEIRVVLHLGHRRAAAASGAAAQGRHRVGIRIVGRRSWFLAEQAAQEVQSHSESRALFAGIGHLTCYSNRESTNSFGSKGSRSPAFSPTPTYLTGNPSSREMATTTPPLAVPSSLVRTIPVTPADSVNMRACCRPF